ncbi:hypothetical protein WA158_006177 [Blastocystis sp. Blastoise]
MVNRFASLAEEVEAPAPAPAPKKVEAPVAKTEKKDKVRRDAHEKKDKDFAPRRGRQFDRHSGTGRGRENSKNGSGAHNWGNNETAPIENTPVDAPEEPVVPAEPEPEMQAAKLMENEAFKPVEVRKADAPEGKKLVKEEEVYFDRKYQKAANVNSEKDFPALH